MKRNAVQPIACAMIAAIVFAPACRIAGDSDSRAAQVRITLDARTRYQTIEGWGGVIANWHWGDGGRGPSVPVTPDVREQALRELVFDLGINRVGFGLPLAAIEAVNDNEDPFVTNTAGFEFSKNKFYLREIVLPLRELVRSRGEPFIFYLNAVLWAPRPGGPRFLVDNPDEYVEFAITALRHFRQQGLEVDYWVMQNEPDLIRTWTPGHVGRLITRLGPRMRAAGFHTRIAVPETMRPATLAPWLAGIAATPGVRPYLGEVSFHSYDYDPSNAEFPPATPRASVAGAARQLGLNVAQTEQGQSGKKNSDAWSRRHSGIGMGLARNLFADVELANASTWQLHAIAGWANAAEPVLAGTYINFHRDAEGYSKGFHYWTLRQVMHYVRPGAVRVAARVEPARDSARYDNPVAALGFVTPQGKAILVVLNSGAAKAVTLTGLPPGDYEVSITTAEQQGAPLNVFSIRSAPVQWTLPLDCVITFRQT